MLMHVFSQLDDFRSKQGCRYPEIGHLFLYWQFYPMQNPTKKFIHL